MILVDGYNGGVAHITADQIRDYNIALYGTGDYVLPVGDQFSYEIVNNNTVNLSSGMVVINGARAVTSYGNTETLTIENGTSGYKRSDIIVAEYNKDNESLIETVSVKVVKGALGSSYADPELVTGVIRAGATKHQMALYRVKINGLSIEAVEQMWNASSILHGAVVPIANGGTGATTAAQAVTNLGANDYCFFKLTTKTGTWSTAGGKLSPVSISNQQGGYFTDNGDSTFTVNKSCTLKASGTINLSPSVSSAACSLVVSLQKGTTDVHSVKSAMDATGGATHETFGVTVLELNAGDVLRFYVKATVANRCKLGTETNFMLEILSA